MTTAIAGATATSVDDIPFNPHKRDYKKAGIIVAFCVIPVTLLVVFTYWPFIQMCGYSFYKMKYIGTPRFIGMKNYIDIFTRPELLATLKLSLYYMAGALIQVALALYLATVLAFHVRGGSFFKGAMFFPYLINGIAVGFIFKFFYTRGYVLDTVLQWCGFTQDTLPGIQTILVLNIILSITGSLSAFEGPYVITSGANGTGTYMVQMDKIAHTDQKVGLASAMAVILLIIIIICTLLQKIVMGFLFRDADDGTAKARKQAKKADKARRRAMKAANKVQAGKAPLFKNGKVSA